jgi:hypothetical protein
MFLKSGTGSSFHTTLCAPFLLFNPVDSLKESSTDQCIVKNDIQVEDFCFILHDTVLMARNDGVLEVLKVIEDSDADSVKTISQGCYNLPRLGESFEYNSILVGTSPTAGTACEDTTLEVEEIMGAGQALCYPRMDERILCKASCNISPSYTHER